MTFNRPHPGYHASLRLIGVAALVAVVSGCFFSPACPPVVPANDPDTWPVVERTDMPGVWQISFTGNLAIDGVFGRRYGPGDHFISFDASGDPKYEGVMAPGNGTALWRWDLQTGAGAPSQAEAGVPDRENADVDMIRDAADTLTVELRYREPFQRRSDLADTDVIVRYEQLRISVDRKTLTGLRRETRSFVNPRVPLPDAEEVVWAVSLRRVDATVVAEPPAMGILAEVTPQGDASPPYAVGQAFDLAGALDPRNGASPTPTEWTWVIYRTVADVDGTILDRQYVAELNGQATSFAADQAGIYTIRLWATDGAQWSYAPSVEITVE